VPPRLVFLILISRRVERQVVTVLSPSQSGKRSFTTVTCSLRAGMGLRRAPQLPQEGRREASKRNTFTQNSGLRADTEAPLLGITCGPACRGNCCPVRSSDDGRPQRYCRATTRLEQLDKKWIPTICVN